MAADELQVWPLGDPPPGEPERPPGRSSGRCARTPRMLADWHERGRAGGPHHAQDIMAPRGTPIVSPVSGRVARSSSTTGPQPSGGHGVSIITPLGSRVSMLHFDRAPLVRAGQRVQVGTPLGLVGNTGARASTTCPHLHIEMVSGGRPVNLYSRLLELQDMARSQAREATQPNRDAISGLSNRARDYYAQMRRRMTSDEREQFSRSVVNALRVALTIAQRTDVDSQRDAMVRMAAATQVWSRIDAELRSPSRILTSPFTAAQTAASDALRTTAVEVEAVRQAVLAELPNVAIAASAGMVIAALAGLWLLSQIGKVR